MEEAPSGAEQKGDDVISVSSGGKQTCEESSDPSSKDSLSSNSFPDNLDQKTEMNEHGRYFMATIQSLEQPLQVTMHFIASVVIKR